MDCWSVKREVGANGRKEGERCLPPDLLAVISAGRTVAIVFDSDIKDKPAVRRAESALALALSKVGAKVKLVRLPGRGDNKVGLDDYLLAHAAVDLRALVAAAEVYTPPDPKGAPGAHATAAGADVLEDDDDPHRLARRFLAGKRDAAGELKLRWWREEHHQWRDGAYQPVLDKEVRANLNRRAKWEFDTLNREAVERWRASGGKGQPPTAKKVTGQLVSDIAGALASETMVSGDVEQPSWLDPKPGDPPADEVLVCRNGNLHLPSWRDGKDCLRPLTPRLFTANAVPFDFNPAAPPPTNWLAFLDSVWPDDQDCRRVLQEWLGYLLLPDTSQQKIAMLVGPPRSGKGTVARVMTQLVGMRNCCSPTLASLSMNFGMQPLLGKTVAVISDARLSHRTDTAVVVERLLSISGEDAQTIDRKHLSQVTAKLPVRFTILTNELPRLNDSSGALAGRLIILPMKMFFYGKEDLGLTSRLLQELPGILLWALEGWRRLRDRGRFVQPESARQHIEDMEVLASPVAGFIADCCVVGPGHCVLRDAIYKRWRAWCETQGREPSNQATFGRDLRAAVPGLGGGQMRVNGGRTRMYEGIRIREEGEFVVDL